MITHNSRDIFVIFIIFFYQCLISIAGEGEIETIKEEHDDNDDQEPVVSCTNCFNLFDSSQS